MPGDTPELGSHGLRSCFLASRVSQAANGFYGRHHHPHQRRFRLPGGDDRRPQALPAGRNGLRRLPGAQPAGVLPAQRRLRLRLQAAQGHRPGANYPADSGRRAPVGPDRPLRRGGAARGGGGPHLRSPSERAGGSARHRGAYRAGRLHGDRLLRPVHRTGDRARPRRGDHDDARPLRGHRQSALQLHHPRAIIRPPPSSFLTAPTSTPSPIF